MNSDNNAREQSGPNVVHLGEGERLPAVPASSQAAEVLKQIIEQILANERKRARLEFIRGSSMFLIFLLVMLAAGIWFARQLLTQLREERRITEQTWQMMASGMQKSPARKFSDAPDLPADLSEASAQGAQMAGRQAQLAAQNRESVAKLEQNIMETSDLLQNKPQNISDEVREKLKKQQKAIEELNARLNEDIPADAAGREKQRTEGAAKTAFVPALASEDLKLRMPIPSL